ncbi:hypothetical protein HD554DRAFT_2315602 [Boletus coccyginus]|nr:hypothetical protein HD554DRAFT_2315602 [Boletus coccyginus]
MEVVQHKNARQESQGSGGGGKQVKHLRRDVLEGEDMYPLSITSMWEDGYRNIVNIDYSAVVIEQMRARHAELRPDMEWDEMDVRALSFEDASFDVTIDKGSSGPLAPFSTSHSVSLTFAESF